MSGTKVLEGFLDTSQRLGIVIEPKWSWEELLK